MTTNNRIGWIDQARGWGMVLVMLGHAPSDPIVHKIIYSVHLPFFFALSGYLSNPARHPGILDFAKARWRNLLLPYFLYSAIGYAGLAVQWARGLHPWGLDRVSPIVGTFLGYRNSSPFNGTLWFVTCLLTTEVIYHSLNRAAKSRAWIAFASSCAVMVLGFTLPFRGNLGFWNLDLALISVAFFALGRWIRTLDDEGVLRRRWKSGLAAAIAIWILALVPSGVADMYTYRFDTPTLWVVGAFAGIVAAFLAAPHLPAFGWVGFVGRYSLVFLALHEWFAFNIARGLQAKFATAPFFATSAGMTVRGLGHLVVGLLVVSPICLAFRRWAPVLVGGKK